MYYYFQSEKDRLNRKRTREASKGVGKPRIGGDFELVDQDGKKFTSKDLLGKFSLVRFPSRAGNVRHLTCGIDIFRILALP